MSMRISTVEDLRRCFSTSTDFNEIFDAFQWAITQPVRDVEIYRLLFYNPSLTPDEVRLFGEKLSQVFPDLTYEIYLWLASVFEATHGSSDNYELAFHYYQKAACARPDAPDPYIDASDCYEPDLNIPPLASLLDFVRRGTENVTDPSRLYAVLARLHELNGDGAEAERCRLRADGSQPDSESLPG